MTIRQLAEFRHLLRQFLHFSEEAAADAGLTPQHHQLMLQIAGASEDEVISVGWAAERLALRHNSVVELAKRCEDVGLLRRERDATNRRRVLLRLTAEGRRVLRRLSEAHRRELEVLGPQLTKLLAHLAPGMKKKTSKRVKRGTTL